MYWESNEVKTKYCSTNNYIEKVHCALLYVQDQEQEKDSVNMVCKRDKNGFFLCLASNQLTDWFAQER